MTTWMRQYIPGRSQKPRTLRINPAHPLGRDLVFATFFNQPGGVPCDAVQNCPGSVIGTIGTWTAENPYTGTAQAPPPSRWGPGMTWTGGTTQGLHYSAGSGTTIGLDRDMTAVVCVRYATIPSTSYSPLLQMDFLLIRKLQSDTTLEVAYNRQTDGAYYRILAPTLPIGCDISIAAVVRADNIDKVYMNGNVHHAGPGSFWFSGTTSRLGQVRLAGNGSDTTIDGTIYAALLYRRALGVDELKTLHECPWIMGHTTQRMVSG
jgi:hypothetical protein